jgi:hypothetical protein
MSRPSKPPDCPSRRPLLWTKSGTLARAGQLLQPVLALGGTFSAVADREEDPASEDQRDHGGGDHGGDVTQDSVGDHQHRETEQKSKHCLSTWHVERVRAAALVQDKRRAPVSGWR